MSELDMTLRLRTINHLFEAPDISPLSDDFQPYSSKAGIDYVLGELYAHPSTDRINLTVLLPRESVTEDLQQRTQQAVRRFTDARAQHVQHDSNRIRSQATRALPVALLGLVVLIEASVPLMESPLFLARAIGNGLSVAGWVALWFPLDALIFQVWLAKQEQRAYRILQGTRISIQEDR
ncbi:MAG: hypothetical protein ACT4P5_20600 [Armatimonadota bacterium]